MKMGIRRPWLVESQPGCDHHLPSSRAYNITNGEAAPRHRTKVVEPGTAIDCRIRSVRLPTRAGYDRPGNRRFGKNP